jgi:hypothetical protein
MAPLKTQRFFFEDGFMFLKSFFSFAYSVSIFKLIFLSELTAFFLMKLKVSTSCCFCIRFFGWQALLTQVTLIGQGMNFPVCLLISINMENFATNITWKWSVALVSVHKGFESVKVKKCCVHLSYANLTAIIMQTFYHTRYSCWSTVNTHELTALMICFQMGL